MNHTLSPKNSLRSFIAAALLALSHLVYAADVITIDNAWVRSTLPGQDVGAAYMTLTSKQNTMLVAAKSDVTDSVEIHSMSMQNGVMKMRMLDSLKLIANKPYKLTPGGFHLMLLDLKKPLMQGQYVNFELKFKTGNIESTQNVKVLVKSGETDEAHDHEHHHH
jgi:copper(I)-binding protein